MKLTIKDGRDHFYTFDTNRILLLTATDEENIRQVEFSTEENGEEVSWTSEVLTGSDGVKYVQVPNEFLNGNYSRLVCYYVALDSNGEYTRQKEIFRIRARQEPQDYYLTYSERVTFASIKALTEQYKATTKQYMDTTEGFKDNAGRSAELASKYAENNEDVAVEPGKYSAKHWSIKAEAAKETAVQKATEAGTSEVNSKTYMESAQSAKQDAETAKNAANTILEQVQSKGTEITNFVATSKTEIETQKNESVNAVKSVYQTDLNELKGDLSDYGNVLNVTNSIPLSEGYYTLETAINAISNSERLKKLRHKGIIITFQTDTYHYVSYQYIDESNIINENVWSNVVYWRLLNNPVKNSIVIACYDSSTEAKENADLFTNAENNGIALINTAISMLPNGGKVYLRQGTYKGSVGVNINVNNITIEGECVGTKIQRASGNDIFANNIKGIILRNITANAINLYNGSEYILDSCFIGNEYKDIASTSMDGTVFVSPKDGIAGINNAIYAMGENGGTIILGIGEYSGDTMINFYKSSSPSGYKNNIRIVGQGYGTVINRSTGYNDVVANSAELSNNTIENVHFANGVQRTIANPVNELRLISCWIGSKYVDESIESAPNIVNVGTGRFFENISSAYAMFYRNSYPISETERWEIHIWGHVVETSSLVIEKARIDLIGHNALVELRGNGNVRANFTDSLNDYYGFGLDINVRDIHFKKTGCYNYYQNYCVYVSSNNVRFYNCIFENASSSPTPFDQRDYVESAECYAGARRHGIGIECTKYGAECKTTFYNCIGIGSPYGFQNTRGWYIIFGSPKLFNCIGYGGGIGEFCHGIINHRSSQAELIGCIGYASKTAFRKSAGIRFQAACSSHLINCIGYGSGGEQYISKGVSAERITEVCKALGIDVSSYVSDGVVQYEILTDAICAELTNDDIKLESLGTNTEEGYGISFWANNGKAKLINCQGYMGSGTNSHGLHIIDNAKPTIQGGYFGVKDNMVNISVVANNGSSMMTTELGGELNHYTPYTITGITITIIGTPIATDDYLYITSLDDVQQTIVYEYPLRDVASIGLPEVTERKIAAGRGIKVFIKRNGSNIEIPSDKFMLHITYNYASDNSSALYLGGNAEPIIANAMICADSSNKAIEAESSVSPLKMFNCGIKGVVDSNVEFAEKTSVNNSSNYLV